MSGVGAGRRVFIDARELDEALGALGDQGSELTVLAGGTDVMVQYLRGDIRPAGLLHVRRIPDLRGVSLAARTTLGALTTHWELASRADLQCAHPALSEAAATVGGRQTQNAGTLAGNVANASPAADLLPVLLAGDAVVALASTQGVREMPVEDFVLGRRETARRPDELITRLTLEPVGERVGETYVKIGRRHAMEVAVVGLAARIALDPDGTAAQVRLALGSVAPKAFRAGPVERRLTGSRLDEEALREAGEILQTIATPIDDARATAGYRRRLLPGLLRAAVKTCQARALATAGDANGS